jgi:hypothetical protein
MMTTPDPAPRLSELYRRYAEQAKERATFISTPCLREAFVRGAAEWTRLAQAAEIRGE